MTDFIMRLPQLFTDNEGEVLYAGRNEVRQFCEGGINVVAKRYKRVNTIQRVVYSFFRRTKAERAFLFAKTLRDRGISTPHEVAYLEQSEGGLFTIGYFVSLSCPDPPAFNRLVPPAQFDRRIAAELSAFIMYMHSHGVLHGDMNFGNFLYHFDNEGKCRFTVIDTNRSHFRQGWPSRKECIENFRTTTHRRDVYAYIVTEYARLRGWNTADTLKEATESLENFEQRHRRKEQLKKLKK